MARYFGAARFGDPLYAAAAAPDGGYWPLVTLWRRTFHLSHALLNGRSGLKNQSSAPTN
jgi:hypothetical protein